MSHINQGQGRGACSSPVHLPRYCSSQGRVSPLLPGGDASKPRISSAPCFFPHYIVPRTYDTIWKRGGETWWRVSRQDLPSAESTDSKSSTRTCFFLIIQRGRVAAISQSSLSCTPRTSLPSQQLLKNALEENARCKSQVLSSSAHLHN